MIERNYESFDDVIFYNAAEKNKNKAILLLIFIFYDLENGFFFYQNGSNKSNKQKEVQ